MLRASNLRDRITIQRRTTTKDPNYGTDVVTWVALATRIAAEVLDALPGKSEASTNGTRMATRPSRVRIRYRSDITADMRIILHRAQDITTEIISGPAIIGHREGLELMVAAYTSHGT